MTIECLFSDAHAQALGLDDPVTTPPFDCTMSPETQPKQHFAASITIDGGVEPSLQHDANLENKYMAIASKSDGWMQSTSSNTTTPLTPLDWTYKRRPTGRRLRPPPTFGAGEVGWPSIRSSRNYEKREKALKKKKKKKKKGGKEDDDYVYNTFEWHHPTGASTAKNLHRQHRRLKVKIVGDSHSRQLWYYLNKTQHAGWDVDFLFNGRGLFFNIAASDQYEAYANGTVPMKLKEGQMLYNLRPLPLNESWSMLGNQHYNYKKIMKHFARDFDLNQIPGIPAANYSSWTDDEKKPEKLREVYDYVQIAEKPDVWVFQAGQ